MAEIEKLQRTLKKLIDLFFAHFVWGEQFLQVEVRKPAVGYARRHHSRLRRRASRPQLKRDPLGSRHESMSRRPAVKQLHLVSLSIWLTTAASTLGRAQQAHNDTTAG